MEDPSEILARYEKQKLEEEKEELLKYAETISAFKNFCLTENITLTEDNIQYIQTIGIVAKYPNLLYKLLPDLFTDKDGLIDLDYLKSRFTPKMISANPLQCDNFMLLFSPFFRRGYYYENNYAPRFLEVFLGLKNSAIDKSILLDADMVRINMDQRGYFERDTWYGAKFNQEINLIDDGIIKLRPPLDLDEFYLSSFFANVYSLDMLWQTKGRTKVFQLEEFKTDKVILEYKSHIFHPVRYIHAEYDIDRKHFKHFDGAIHFYSENEYFNRRDSDLNYNLKAKAQIKAISQKLFKLEGIIPVETFADFTSQFLTGDPLVFEYFEGKYPDNIQGILNVIQNRKSTL